MKRIVIIATLCASRRYGWNGHRDGEAGQSVIAYAEPIRTPKKPTYARNTATAQEPTYSRNRIPAPASHKQDSQERLMTVSSGAVALRTHAINHRVLPR